MEIAPAYHCHDFQELRRIGADGDHAHGDTILIVQDLCALDQITRTAAAVCQQNNMLALALFADDVALNQGESRTDVGAATTA